MTDIEDRARRVALGESTDEKSPKVLARAADMVLAPYLTARVKSQKGDILSFRQIVRRRQKEFPSEQVMQERVIFDWKSQSYYLTSEDDDD